MELRADQDFLKTVHAAALRLVQAVDSNPMIRTVHEVVPEHQCTFVLGFARELRDLRAALGFCPAGASVEEIECERRVTIGPLVRGAGGTVSCYVATQHTFWGVDSAAVHAKAVAVGQAADAASQCGYEPYIPAGYHVREDPEYGEVLRKNEPRDEGCLPEGSD